DEFPACSTRRSGCPGSARVDGPGEAAQVLRAAWETGGRGVVVAVPPPADLEGAEEMASRAAGELGDLRGASVTPRLLARMAELSGGRSLDLNVDLVVNNARVAAQVARTFFSQNRIAAASASASPRPSSASPAASRSGSGSSAPAAAPSSRTRRRRPC